MTRTSRSPARTATTALALLVAAVGLAGCGTPALIKPVQTPLPGFKRDIQAAQSVVTKADQQAQAFGATGVTTP